MSVSWEPLKYLLAGVGGLTAFSLFAQLLTTNVFLDQDAMEAEGIASQLERGAMMEHHVGQSPGAALATYSKKIAWEQLDAAKSAGERAQIAASIFIGYWMANGRGRAEVCAEHDVDLSPVLEKFERRHADLHARALALLPLDGMSEERLYEIHRGPILRQIGSDMLYMHGAPTSVAESCKRLVDEPHKFLTRTDFDAIEPGIAHIIRQARIS
jgi:hypothetical protein